MSFFRRLIMTCAVSSCAYAVTVYTMDEQFSHKKQTVLRFKVENNSSDTLNGIELRYHVVGDTSIIEAPEYYYFPEGSANWSFEDSVNATLVIYFPEVILYPGDVLGGSSGYAIGLHNKEWAVWTKADDPSQPKSEFFSVAENVEVLSGGKSLMPDLGKYTGCPVVQFVAVTKDSVSLQIKQQSDADLASIAIKNKNGIVVSANLNESTIDAMGQKIWHGYMPTQDTVEHRGEIWAECNGQLLSYFAYGWKPTGAMDAVKKNLWPSTDSFVKADFDMGFNQGLIEGQRLVLQKDSLGQYLDARRTENWKFYRTWEEPGENPMPVIWSSPLMQYDESDIDSLTLEWSPIEEVNWYRLLVIRDSLVGDSVLFVDTTVSMFTMRTSVKIPVLPAGKYVWYVDPLIEVPTDENIEGEEYYIITGDDANPESGNLSGNPPVLRAPWHKRVGRWAKKTVKKAVEYISPATKVTQDIATGNLTWNNALTYTGSFLVNRVNPFGFIQIFVHTETIHTRVNAVTKNMEWLQKTYDDRYVYNALLTDKCFGSSAFCAMKDSRMLAENWNVGFNEKNWDRVFPKKDVNGNTNYAVHNRCWLTMAQMINHYKGGNIASDEILYNVRGGFSDTAVSNAIESMQAVNYALGLDVWDQVTHNTLLNSFKATGLIPSVDGWSAGTPFLHTIITTIESGNVLGVTQSNGGAHGGHAMVLNGYKIKSNGNVDIHLLNVDNMGGSEWRYYCNISFLGLDVVVRFVVNGIGQLVDLIRDQEDNGKNLSGDMFLFYYIPPQGVHGRLANASVFEDSDGDSIVDIDENKRFGTNPLRPDSDGDGINDYNEILDFKKCETYGGYYVSSIATLIDLEPQMSYVLQSDFDGDGLHAAVDRDSDGDGYCDGQEQGFLEMESIHKCERFDARKHPEGVIPLCNEVRVALLAKEKLQLNDRASCIALNGLFCPVASYENSFNDLYGVRLGVDASVGNVYSTKSVLLRDRAKVYGNLETAGNVVRQSSTALITGNVVEGSTQSNENIARYESIFNDVVVNGDFTIYRNRNINSGEFMYSNILGAGSNNTEFNFNSGSNLVLNVTGNFLVGSLKFQHGSKLYVPAEGDVVFHVGNDFQWNGTVETNDMISAAQHVMIYYYGVNRVFVQTDFAGTIVAPNAEVVVGQSGKNFYGAIYAKSIVVHQNAKITWVPFAPLPKNTVVAGVGDFSLPSYVFFY